jgi:hypothetical protein
MMASMPTFVSYANLATIAGLAYGAWRQANSTIKEAIARLKRINLWA